jgi:hypothetical protein
MKGLAQNYFCDKLRGFYVGCDAIWCKKWIARLPKGNNQSILRIY